MLVEETVTDARSWLARLPGVEDDQLITADGGWLASVLDSSTKLQTAEWIETPRNLAGAIAACAEADLQAGAPGDPSTLDANYVRRSDAELYWSDN